MARIAVGGFQHETNTFAPSLATLADFEAGGAVAGAHHRPRAVGPVPRHEHLDRGVHRGGGAGGAPAAADHLGRDIALLLRHRARLRAHRGPHPRRPAGRAALRRRVPLPARGDGGRAPPGRGGRAAAPGALPRRQRPPGRRLARPSLQHDAGDDRVRGRARRLPDLPPHRHGGHGAAHRPAPRRVARGLGGGAQGVPPDPVHHSDYLAVHDDRADAVRHGDAGRPRRRGRREPVGDPGLSGRGHPPLRPRGARVRAHPGCGPAGGGCDRGRDRAARERIRGRALRAGRRGAGRDRDRPQRVPSGRHRRHPGQSGRRGRLRHHRDAAGARGERRPAGRARMLVDPEAALAAHGAGRGPRSPSPSAASPAFRGTPPSRRSSASSGWETAWSSAPGRCMGGRA